MSYILKITFNSIKYITNQINFPFVFNITCNENTQKTEELNSKDDKINKSFFFKSKKPIEKIEILANKTSMFVFSSIVRLFFRLLKTVLRLITIKSKIIVIILI